MIPRVFLITMRYYVFNSLFAHFWVRYEGNVFPFRPFTGLSLVFATFSYKGRMFHHRVSG